MVGDGDAITVTGLRKRYHTRAVTTQAIDGIDLTIRAGEIFALLGPNGAGKSTTVEILEGYRTRDAGEVRVLGVDPQRAGSDWRQRIGIVLQNTKDLSELTVTESLQTFAAFYVNPRPISETLELVGLTEKARARGNALSGGQRPQLDVALGLIGRPELLFLDEPTTGFDPEARRQFWELIAALRTEGTTILLTTHYLEEAEALADRVGVINHGRLLEVNTPERLGGRDTAKARVSYTGADGRRVTLLSGRPTRLVAELSTQFGGEVPDLSVSRPSLEDVYLQMIGVGEQ